MTFALSARWASCSGRTFDGPQPKRPSAGLSSSGMVSVVALVVMGLLVVRVGVPRRAAEGTRRSPVVVHLETPVATVPRRVADGRARLGAPARASGWVLELGLD